MKNYLLCNMCDFFLIKNSHNEEVYSQNGCTRLITIKRRRVYNAEKKPCICQCLSDYTDFVRWLSALCQTNVDRIVVSADAETIKQGESVELEVKGFDKKNKEMKVSKPTWSAEPDNLGELDVNGAKAVFTAGETAEGKVTITVTSGNLSDSIEITIIKETTSVDKSDLEDAIQAATQLKQSTEV